MALSFTSLAATPSTTNTNSYASASVSPAANRLLLVAVLVSRGASTDPVVPTLSGNGIAYDHVDDGVTEGNNLFVPSGTLRYRLCLFFALTGASPSAGAVTVDLGGVTHTGCAIIVAQSNEEVDLADAIVQVDLVAPGFVASAAAAMAAFADAANAAFSVWALDETAAITHEGTELADITYSTPAARLQAQFLGSEDTTPGVSWTGNANVGGIAVEVRIAAGGPIEVATGIAVESDAALASTVAKTQQFATGTAAETNAALASTTAKHVSSGIAEEADSALASTTVKAQILETGVAEETDAALSSTVAKTQVLETGVAEETDEALPSVAVSVGEGTIVVNTGFAQEADAALPSTVVKTQFVTTGVPVELSAALASIAARSLSTGLAEEAALALASTVVKTQRLTTGVAVAVEAALPSTMVLLGGRWVQSSDAGWDQDTDERWVQDSGSRWEA